MLAPMLSVTASKVIAVPPETAWSVLSDTSRYAEYVEGTDEVSRSGGPAAVGVTYEEVNPILGPWKARTTWTVVEFDAPHRQVHRSPDIPLASRMDVIMEVMPEGDGSRVTFTLQAAPSLGPLGALFMRAMRSQVERDNEKTLANFAALAEAERVAPVPETTKPG
jgi:carbon monoxide dehydrogenase subunit G